MPCLYLIGNIQRSAPQLFIPLTGSTEAIKSEGLFPLLSHCTQELEEPLGRFGPEIGSSLEQPEPRTPVDQGFIKGESLSLAALELGEERGGNFRSKKLGQMCISDPKTLGASKHVLQSILSRALGIRIQFGILQLSKQSAGHIIFDLSQF